MTLIFLLALAGLDLKTVNTIDMSEHELYTYFPFVVTEKGTIIAGDDQEHKLLYIDQEGSLIHKVGTRGQGPSEFQNIATVQWYPEEQCVRITDFGNRRYSRWNEAGTFIDEVSFPSQMIFDFWFLDQNTLITSRDLAGHFEAHPRLVRMNLKDPEQKVLWSHKLPKPMEVTQASKDGNSIARLLRWDPKVVFGVGSDFMVVLWSQNSKIHLIDFNGKPLLKPFACDLPQPPITKEQEAAQIEEFPPEWRSALAENLVKFEFWPSVEQLTVDKKDRIWAFGYSKAEGEPHPFRVYDRQGNVLAKGQVPNLPSAVHTDALYYTVEQEDTVILHKAAF